MKSRMFCQKMLGFLFIMMIAVVPGLAWNHVVPVADSVDIENSTDFAIDRTGRIHFVYSIKNDDNDHDLLYVNSANNGNDWSNPIVFDYCSAKPQLAKIAVDSDDNIHVIYAHRLTVSENNEECPGQTNETAHFYYIRSTSAGASWSTPICDEDFAGFFCWNHIHSFAIATQFVSGDNNDIIHVVFSSHVVGNPDHYFHNLYYLKSLDNGSSWSDLELVSIEEAYDAEFNWLPSIEATDDGYVHLIWIYKYDVNSDPSVLTFEYKVKYRKWIPLWGGFWGNAINILTAPSNNFPYDAKVSVDSTGYPHIAVTFQRTNTTPYRGKITEYYLSGSLWLSRTIEAENVKCGWNCVLGYKIDENNKQHISYKYLDASNYDDIVYKSFTSGSWSSRTIVRNTADSDEKIYEYQDGVSRQ